MNIPFSEFDIKAKVILPKLNDAILAYETGVHIGDGSLQLVDGGTHSVRYFGHAEDDWLFYSEVMPSIIKKLYNKKVAPTKRKDARTCTLSLCSKAIAHYKRDLVGLPVGSKEKLNGMPSFVKKKRTLLINCIRGIVDTDFSLFFYKKGGLYSHPAISCTMSNKHLVLDLESAIKGLGFVTSARYDVQRKRNGREHIEHVLTICGKDQLKKFVEIIGFWNPKHFSKFQIWSKTGQCIPKQSTEDRLLFISSF